MATRHAAAAVAEGFKTTKLKQPAAAAGAKSLWTVASSRPAGAGAVGVGARKQESTISSQDAAG